MRVLPIEGALACCAVYVSIGLMCYYLFLNREKFNSRIHITIKKHSALIIILAILTVLSVIQSLIDPYSLQVDRWSAIHNFLSNLLNGNYPYAAQTHLGGYGSPFPVWQLVHLPFYLIGNVGLSFVVGTLLFYDSLRRVAGVRKAFLAVLMLISSPAYLYEVMVRSDLLTNFLVVAALIFYMYLYKITPQNRWSLVAVIGGLVLATRFSAVIPLCICFFPQFIKLHWKQQMGMLLVAALTFVLVFLPFVLWNGDMIFFFEYNPFVLQTRQGHIIDFILVASVGIILALYCRDSLSRYTSATAIVLLLLVIITFVHNMWVDNTWNQLFESRYDITYFNMSLPFIILSLVLTRPRH